MFPLLIVGVIALLILSKRESVKVPVTYPIEGSDGNFYRIIVRKGGIIPLSSNVTVDQNLYERKGDTSSYYMMILASTMGINPNAKPIFVKFAT